MERDRPDVAVAAEHVDARRAALPGGAVARFTGVMLVAGQDAGPFRAGSRGEERGAKAVAPADSLIEVGLCVLRPA